MSCTATPPEAPPVRKCRCSPHEVARYRSRISGPLLDRIALQVDMSVAPFDRLVEERREEASNTVRQRFEASWGRKRRRDESGYPRQRFDVPFPPLCPNSHIDLVSHWDDEAEPPLPVFTPGPTRS